MKKLITKKDFILLVIVLIIGVLGISLVNSANKGTTADVVANVTTEAGKTYYQKYML